MMISLYSSSKFFHFTSRLNSYIIESFVRIFCPTVESLQGKIAFFTGWFSSMILSKSTCKVSQVQLHSGQAHSILFAEKCAGVYSGKWILQLLQ